MGNTVGSSYGPDSLHPPGQFGRNWVRVCNASNQNCRTLHRPIEPGLCFDLSLKRKPRTAFRLRFRLVSGLAASSIVCNPRRATGRSHPTGSGTRQSSARNSGEFRYGQGISCRSLKPNCQSGLQDPPMLIRPNGPPDGRRICPSSQCRCLGALKPSHPNRRCSAES
jgi:hypothetical protein